MSGDDLFDLPDHQTQFVEVILPLALSKNYTYRVPAHLNEAVKPGKRVIVQFGKHKMYTAIIRSIGSAAPIHYQAKYIIDVADQQPVINEQQLRFWEWLASYYLCNEGDVMAAALPAALKLASETIVILNPEPPEAVQHDLSEKEAIIMNALSGNKKLDLDEIAKLLEQKTIYPFINSLLSKELILILEEVNEKFKPSYKTYVTLDPLYEQEAYTLSFLC
ncbi:MAG: hypothetical protein EOO92_09560 [Pedobacter sp.]|nr:MAG: hypothetical protein EOO92_09560 [Pedobacter sp.]